MKFLLLKKAKDLKADVFGFGEVLHKKYPQEWKELKDTWRDIFPAIEVTVDVSLTFKNEDRLTAPIFSEEE